MENIVVIVPSHILSEQQQIKSRSIWLLSIILWYKCSVFEHKLYSVKMIWISQHFGIKLSLPKKSELLLSETQNGNKLHRIKRMYVYFSFLFLLYSIWTPQLLLLKKKHFIWLRAAIVNHVLEVFGYKLLNASEWNLLPDMLILYT